MIRLLKEKGYNKENTFEDILDWLSDKGIYVDILTYYDDGEVKGYWSRASVSPCERYTITECCTTRKAALELIIAKLIDYIN